MSNPVFLIDLASARPTTPPSPEQWRAIAKQHGNQLIRCIQRILAHSDVKSFTTHVFDSTFLTHAGKPTTRPIKSALEDLKHLNEQIVRLDPNEFRHPTAHGIHAGITDAAPEDSFADFYTDSTTAREVFVFARAPTTRKALAAFIASKESALTALETNLAKSSFLPKKFRELAKRGDRVIWVNSTPRRCEQPGEVDHQVEQAFSIWLLSHSSQFRFANLHSFLIDRRIVPANTMVKSLRSDPGGGKLSSGKPLDVLCLQGSQLVRCVSALMNTLEQPAGKSETCQSTLVLSALVRNYETTELTKLGAFDTSACFVTPAPISRMDDDRSSCSSVFAGLMVDLARQNMCLIADYFEIDEADESFSRYQTLLQPISPLSAVLRKLSRNVDVVNSSNACLPQSYDEWVSWDKLRKVEDCDITDAAIDASAKFFETYLPGLFTSSKRMKIGDRGTDDGKDTVGQRASCKEDGMFLSFEGGSALLGNYGQQVLSAQLRRVNTAPVAMKDEHGKASETPDHGTIVKKLKSRLEKEKAKQEQSALRQAPPTCVQTPDKSGPSSTLESPSKTNGKFRWRRRIKVVAPSEKEIHTCIDLHSNVQKSDDKPEAILKKEEVVSNRQPETHALKAPHDNIQAHLSPTTSEECNDECPVAGEGANALPPLPEGDIVSHLGSVERKTIRKFPLPELTGFESAPPVEPMSTTPKGDVHADVAENKLTPQKRKIDIVQKEVSPEKRHRTLKPLDKKEEAKEQLSCEEIHGAKVRQAVEVLSACISDLRRGDSQAIEGVIWKCLDHLSSLAELLAKFHGNGCDLDRMIHLNLKIPKAITSAVQLIQNKAKAANISAKVLTREIWETVISAFEQTVWHLACLRRKATYKPDRSIRRRVRKVETILSCTQLMAEMATAGQRQPVSFREIWSKLFSSVFVCLSRKDSGEPIPSIVALFERFEEPIPASLLVSNKNDVGDQEKSSRADLATDEPYQSQSQRPSSNHKVSTPSVSGRLAPTEGVHAKASKERRRSRGTSNQRLVKDARTKAPKIALGRPQFAKESEALRNAAKSQTRLPLQSKKPSSEQRQRLKETSRKDVTKERLDGSMLRDMLASISPEEAIDDLSGNEFEETVDQTPPPRRNALGSNTGILEAPITRRLGGSLRGIFAAPKEQKTNCDQGRHLGNENGKRSSVESAQNDNISLRSNPAHVRQVNGDSRVTKYLTVAIAREHKKVTQSVQHAESSCAPQADLICASTNKLETKIPDEKKDATTKTKSSPTTRRVTRQQVTQAASEAMTKRELSDESGSPPQRLTRSQTKKNAQKRKLTELADSKKRTPGSSGRKRRRGREVTNTAELGVDSLKHDCSQESPASSSPMTRSKVRALGRSASLQVGSRSMNPPKKQNNVKPRTRGVVSMVSKVPAGESLPEAVIDEPKSPHVTPCTPVEEILSPETPCNAETDPPSPKTPVPVGGSKDEESALSRIVTSSMEKRKEQLNQEDFIPETPVAPKASIIIPPNRGAVCRALNFDN